MVLANLRQKKSQPSLQGEGWEKEKMSNERTIKLHGGAGNPRPKGTDRVNGN